VEIQKRDHVALAKNFSSMTSEPLYCPYCGSDQECGCYPWPPDDTRELTHCELCGVEFSLHDSPEGCSVPASNWESPEGTVF
jgi:hypothetical protein